MAKIAEASSGREKATRQGTSAELERCSCTGGEKDQLLEAARQGWAVTVRYSLLVMVSRWPALLFGAGGTGALTLAAGYARAQGWI